jgi:hypothetical protein
MGAHYRHTTPEMAARVVDAIQQRLAIVLRVAELAFERSARVEPREKLIPFTLANAQPRHSID